MTTPPTTRSPRFRRMPPPAGLPGVQPSRIARAAIRLLPILLLLSGCASPHASRPYRPRGPVPPRDASLPAVQGQYADPAQGAFPVYEVHLSNTGAAARVFAAVELDGRLLRRPVAALLAAPTVSIGGQPLKLPPAPADPDLAWWQFLPSAVVPPDGAAVLRLCFRDDVRTPRALVLRDAEGGSEALAVPARRPSNAPRLAAVAWSHDLSRVQVLCDSPGNPPAALWIGGRPARDPRVLSSPGTPRRVLLEAGSPVPLSEGLPVDLRVLFADGSERLSHRRALSGVFVYDAPARELSDARIAAGDDDLPCPCDGGDSDDGSGAGACLIPVDATCSDLRAGRPGDAAWRVVREREFLASKNPQAPAGFAFCAGTTPDTAAVYGRAADVLFAKPYRLGWGRDPARFLDEEADTLAAQRDACVPLPFFYVPERFARRGGRRLSPDELETLEWSAVVQGAKGLRRHFAYNKGGLSATPDLAVPLRTTAAGVRRLRPLLAPLVPVSDETRGDEAAGYVRVLSAWSGSQGALYLVRVRDAGSYPDGAPLFRDVPVELDVPPWCLGREVLDLRTGERLADSLPGRLRLVLPELRAFRLLWIDADPGHPALKALPRTRT